MYDNDGPHDAEGNDLVASYQLPEQQAEEFRETVTNLLGGHVHRGEADRLAGRVLGLARLLVAHVILG
jgi:hypothetical protein